LTTPNGHARDGSFKQRSAVRNAAGNKNHKLQLQAEAARAKALYWSSVADRLEGLCTVQPNAEILAIQGTDLASRRKISADGSYHGIYVHVGQILGLTPGYIATIDSTQTGPAAILANLAAFRAGALKLLRESTRGPEGRRNSRGRHTRIAPIADFHRGGRYYGVLLEASRALSLSSSTISSALKGRSRMPYVEQFIRAQMIERDRAASSPGVEL
jgi:hypothetical protein